MITMGESFMWIFALLILLFGGNFGGFFGGNRGPAPDQVTQAELQAGLNNVQTQNQLQQLGIATANNNYETAILINQLGNNITQQNQNNLVNAIQGFNALTQTITGVGATLGSKLDNLGYQMDQCCCSIKTQMLQDKYERVQAELVTAQNKIDNANQTQTILGSLGRFVAWAGSGSQAAAAAGA
jgi:hypothetical protein